MRRLGEWLREGRAGSDSSTVCSLDCQLQIDYVLDNYRGTSKYSLSHVNSILYKDGKVYNLLQRMSPKRRIRCGCVKSNCEAKYCECYRAGETCGEGCSCLSCKNRKFRKNGPGSREDDQTCNCVKSGCLKKYCECFQNGRKCTPRCGCCDCKNLEHQT